ncbi:hypothetical protein Goarm_005996, partial [Gossypium armourianum]|nr:hypothetical protein [Gossypium armourianum]
IDVIDGLTKVWTILGNFHTNEVFENYVSIDRPQSSNEKGLKSYDEITFMTRPQQEGGNGGPQKEFKVLIKRKIRLFGQNILGEIM